MKPTRETPQLTAMAFTDAMRDILISDGKFHLDDDPGSDAVWQWDGVRWSRIPLTWRAADDLDLADAR
jgi:hypothetical protein